LLLLNSSYNYYPPSYVTNVGNRNSFHLVQEMAGKLQAAELVRSQDTHGFTLRLGDAIRRTLGENEFKLTKDTRKIKACIIND